MLEFNDIRIGNKVALEYLGKTTTILDIKNNMILLQSFPTDTLAAQTDIYGIPLTVSILKQLSFTNAVEENTWQREGVSIHLKKDGLFYGLRNFKGKAKIQFVHQLQNYVTDFYALFREQEYSLDISALQC